jgi:hypothetical protein
MKRSAIIPIVIGSVSVLFPSVTLAATLVHEATYPLTNNDWATVLIIPKYNPADHGSQPLKSVFVEAIANSSGTYTLQKTGTSNIRYGAISSSIGSELEVIGPSNSAILTPVPLDSVGTGRLTSANPLFTTTIDGSDSDSETLDLSFLNLYSGTGNVSFDAMATSLVNISKSGTPFTETADIKASLLLRVTYEFDAPPPKEIPEPGFNVGIFAIALCGLTSLVWQKQ